MWITDILRRVVRRLFPTHTLEKKLNIKIASSAVMENAIMLWRQMYQNQAPWLNEYVKSQELPASICEEMTRLMLIEFNLLVDGSQRADFINNQLKRWFTPVMNEKLQLWCALGGMAFKPYISGIDQTTGKPREIRIDYIGADRFMPVSFDSNSDVTAAVFFETKVEQHHLYTRVEYHRLEGTYYTIENRAFMSEYIESANDNSFAAQYPFNEEVPLNRIDEWKGITPVVTMTDITRPFFVYVRIPKANTIDIDSPLGVSVYSRAVGTIAESDRQYSRTLWEYEAKETAIDASSDLFMKDINGKPILPEGRDRLFRTYDFDNDEGTFKVFSPEIRDTAMFNGNEKLKRAIEFQVGLAYGTLSDPEAVERTATEIISSKKRSYDTIKKMQDVLDEAIGKLIEVMDELCTLYQIEPAGICEKHIEWGDGILEDTDKEYQRRWSMVQSGKLKPEKFLSWYFNCSEEEARDYLPAYDVDDIPDEE